MVSVMRSTSRSERRRRRAPIGSRLKRLSDIEAERMTLLMEGALAVQAGSQPRLLGERLQAMVPMASAKGAKAGKVGKSSPKPLKKAA